MAKEIRTHYAGFVNFAAKLVTVATGTAFQLIVANWLSQSEYGAWAIFNIIIPNFTLLSAAISFWTMRFVARNKEGATKTGIMANLTIAIMATTIYLGLLPILTSWYGLGNYTLVYAVASLQIVETYLLAVFEASLQAQRPDYVGYGLLVGEISKILLAYVLIVRFDLLLLGTAISVVAGFTIKTAFYFKVVLNELRQKMVFSYVREWLKGSVFSVYNIAGDRIAAFVFVVLTNYVEAVGSSYYYAALQIANIITYSTFIAFALQPKLLAEGKIDEATASLKMVLMFAIPMTAGVIATPTSYLVFLKESAVYAVAAPILIVLALDAFIMTVSSVFTFVLFGIERVDEKAKIPFRQVVKSRLFIAFTLPYAHAAITWPSTLYILSQFPKTDPIPVITYVTGVNTVAHLAMLIVVYGILRKDTKIRIPWKSVGKYALASLIMAVILFFAHPTRRLTTLVFAAVGGIVYFGLITALDKEIRTLIRTILLAIRETLRRKLRG